MFSKLYVVLILLSVIVGSIVYSLIETNDNTNAGDYKYIKYTEYSLYASATILGAYMLFYILSRTLVGKYNNNKLHFSYIEAVSGFILLGLNIWMMVNSIIVLTNYRDSIHIDLARNIGVVMTATLCFLTGIVFTIGLGVTVLLSL